MINIKLFFLFFATGILAVTVFGCSSNVDCPQDQCCGHRAPDLIGLFQSCQPYSKEGEGCHGNILFATCDCEPGLVCVEHTGIFALLHTSKGVCQTAPDGLAIVG